MPSNEKMVECPKCRTMNRERSLICSSCFSALPSPQFDIRSDNVKRSLEDISETIRRRIEGRLQGGKIAATPAERQIFVKTAPDSLTALARKELNLHPDLRQIDRIMDEDFKLLSRFINTNAFYPTVYCETLDEYFEPLLSILNISESSKKDHIEDLKRRAEMDALRGGGEFGMNLPGLGCYINGWFFAYRRARNAAEALADPAIKPRILETVAHEKHGHGFITEFTASGKEKKEIHLFRYQNASRFNLKLADTPDEVLLNGKWEILFQSSMFLEEGWSVWIAEYLSKKMGLNGAKPTEASVPFPRVEDVISFLGNQAQSLYAGDRRPVEAYSRAMATLFGGASADEPAIHAAVIELQRYEEAVAPTFVDMYSRYPRYVIGRFLVKKVEERCGEMCVPYAVAIAANVRYDLKAISNTDLDRVVHQEARLNQDTRLAMLGFLSLDRKNDVADLALKSRETLNLKIPENLRI